LAYLATGKTTYETTHYELSLRMMMEFQFIKAKVILSKNIFW